jgi:NTP pyrophosphatase (non-canonical NTP hydrolase)
LDRFYPESRNLQAVILTCNYKPGEDLKTVRQIEKEYYMNTIEELTSMLVKFRDERDWGQFHKSKDLALALSIEAAEVNELFLWKEAKDVNEEKLKDEIADVLAYAFLLAHRHGFNVEEIVKNKIIKNAEKYPVEKSKGSVKKYNEL